MKKHEFFNELTRNRNWQSRLINAARRSDGNFYFTLGEIFGELEINGWASESFICKVCNICEIEF